VCNANNSLLITYHSATRVRGEEETSFGDTASRTTRVEYAWPFFRHRAEIRGLGSAETASQGKWQRFFNMAFAVWNWIVLDVYAALEESEDGWSGKLKRYRVHTRGDGNQPDAGLVQMSLSALHSLRSSHPMVTKSRQQRCRDLLADRGTA
jgi:hypothetical protein